jgi:hypothetical protein
MDYGVINETDGNAIQTEKLAVGSFARTNTDAAGNVAYTGLGFKPSSIHFLSAHNGNVGGSVGWASGSGAAENHNLSFNSDYVVDDLQASTAVCIRIFQTASNNTRATLVSFDSDGFTLNWLKTGSPTGSTNNEYIAYK